MPIKPLKVELILLGVLMGMAMQGFSLASKANKWAYREATTTGPWVRDTANKAQGMVRKPLM
jgi:hypothetical protein